MIECAKSGKKALLAKSKSQSDAVYAEEGTSWLHDMTKGRFRLDKFQPTNSNKLSCLKDTVKIQEHHNQHGETCCLLKADSDVPLTPQGDEQASILRRSGILSKENTEQDRQMTEDTDAANRCTVNIFRPMSLRKSPEKPLIVVMGAAGVGKTALINQFLHGSFSRLYTPTVEYMDNITLQFLCGKEIHCQILDTAGSFDFPAMRELYIRKGDAFVLVYKTSCRESIDRVSTDRHEILQVREDNPPPIVIAGNIFIGQDIDNEKHKFLVEFHHPRIEFSAKKNFNVNKVFSAVFCEAIEEAKSYVSKCRSEPRSGSCMSCFGDIDNDNNKNPKLKERNSCSVS